MIKFSETCVRCGQYYTQIFDEFSQVVMSEEGVCDICKKSMKEQNERQTIQKN